MVIFAINNKKSQANSLAFKSGKRDSDPRPSAWEADALPLSYSRKLFFIMSAPQLVTPMYIGTTSELLPQIVFILSDPQLRTPMYIGTTPELLPHSDLICATKIQNLFIDHQILYDYWECLGKREIPYCCCFQAKDGHLIILPVHTIGKDLNGGLRSL